MKNQFIIFILLYFFLFSCSNNSENNSKTSEINEEVSNNIGIASNEITECEGEVHKYSFKYKDVKYLYQKCKNHDGITNAEGRFIIPAKFDFIILPDETYAGMVEVCKNGKFGLYSFPEGKEILPPEYDEFYPVFDERILAYYKKGDSYGIVKKNKSDSDSEFKDYSISPFENGTITKWDFSFPSQPVLISENKEEEVEFYYMPSFMKNFFDNLILEGYLYSEVDYMPDIDLSITGNIKANNKKYYFAKILIDSNPWSPDVNYFVCGANLCEKFYEGTTNNYSRVMGVEGVFEFKILDNGIFRIKNSVDGFNGLANKSYPKTTLDAYYYYHIIDGKVEELKPNRFFAFTKYENITSEFFQGFFLGEDVELEDYIGVIVFRHLSIKDLDVMRNEIFADYGYKFKTEQWQNFFGQLDWYKPKFDNVDAKLNAIEKANIQLILQEKSKIKKDEAKYLQKDTAYINMAG